MSHQQRWQPYRAPARWMEVLITLLGLLGLGLGLTFYDQAFPSGAIDLRLSRDEIARRAQLYLQAQGFRADDYEFVLDFAEDDWASFYLQRALGVPGTNRRGRAENLPIWYWHARWFKPLQKEEFGVDRLPDGTLLNFSHTVLETAPGAKISQEQARALAGNFLAVDRRRQLAAIIAAQGNAVRAEQLYGAVEALFDTLAVPCPTIDRIEYDRSLAAVRAQLDEAIYTAACAAGRALTIEQAIESALADTGELIREQD